MRGERGIGSGADIGVSDFSAAKQPPRAQEAIRSEWPHPESGPPTISDDQFGSNTSSQEISDDRLAEQETHSEFSPEFS